jgi:protein NrfC
MSVDEKRVPRRQFLKGVGVGLVAGGVVASGASVLMLPLRPTTVVQVGPPSTPVYKTLPKSGVIERDATKCAGCERCVLACSLVHEGVASIQLSRIEWREEFIKEHYREPFFCQQCDSPSCYVACPKQDVALCIDTKTGARYVNISECIGCGLCVKACPATPARVKLDPVRKVAIKCDLCKDRVVGPACIQVCSKYGGEGQSTALSFTSAEAR